MNLEKNHDYNHIAIMNIFIGYKQGAVAAYEHRDPSFLFQNLS